MNGTVRKRAAGSIDLERNLESNLRSLSKQSPELYDYLSALPAKGLQATLVLTHDNFYTRETIRNGRKEYINSLEAPWDEAELQMRTVPPLNSSGCVHYFGIGLGYHLLLLFKKNPDLEKVFVYEQAADWLLLAFSVHNFSQELSRGALEIRFDYANQREPGILRGKNDFIWINPSFARVYEDFFKRKLSRFVEAEKVSSNTALIIDPKGSLSSKNLSSCVSSEFKAMGWKTANSEAGTNAIESSYFQYLPELIFSASFSSRISKLAGSLKVPYACWEIEKVTNADIFQPGSLSPYTFIFTPFYEDVMKFQFAGAQAFFLPPVPTILVPEKRKDPGTETQTGSDLSYIEALSPDSEISLARLIKKIEDLMSTGNDEIKKEGELLINALERALKRQKGFTFKNIYRLPDILVEELNDMPSFKFFSFNPHLLHYVLGKESGALQTRRYLKSLSPRTVSVYGDSLWKTCKESNLRYRGHADLGSDFQSIVRTSKINLGISAISELDGFNDKPFNILKSGGFFLTNRTHLIEESFQIGKELVVFESPDDLKLKCEYYLREDKERVDIAEKGMRRVNKDHTTRNRLKRILELVPVRKQEGNRVN